jgi:hypothetical protein
VGEGTFGIGPKPGPAGGARWGISIGGPFSIELTGTYLDTKRDVKNPGLEGDFTTVGEADIDLITIDARIKFMLLGQRTWRRISPHFLVGAGFTFDVAGSQAEDQLVLPADRYNFGTSFSGLLGFGARWFLTDRFLIRPDFTLQLWQQDIPEGYAVREALIASPREEWIQSWSLMIGLSYNF